MKTITITALKQAIKVKDDLVGYDLSGLRLNNLDFSHMNLSESLFNCNQLNHTNFTGAILNYANFSYVNSSYANFSHAKMNGVIAYHSNWVFTNFSDADCSQSIFYGSDFRLCNLDDSNFTDSNLQSCMSTKSSFKDIDIRGADFSNASLELSYELTPGKLSETTSGIVSIVPSEGSFIAYKKACGKIVVLEILESARRYGSTSQKCRADKARVIRIEEMDGTLSSISAISSDSNPNFIYKVGEIVESEVDIQPTYECCKGIHFFMSKQLAKEWS